MPTNLNSAQLEQMGREFTQRAVFSAGCNHLQTVQAIRDGSRKILNGEWLNASAREFLQAVLKFYNYEAPEDAEGTIRDMTTPGRQNLIFDQTVAQARNFAWKENLLADDRPHAWQLVRVGTAGLGHALERCVCAAFPRGTAGRGCRRKTCPGVQPDLAAAVPVGDGLPAF